MTTASSKTRLPSDPRIIFMGTPSFSVPCLKALVEAHYDVVAAVTQPDRPKGRGRRMVSSPVKECALERGIEVWQPENINEGLFLDRIRDKNPDLLVVVAFGQILKKALLSSAPSGVLNIHASLLPRHRGAAPIQWAILSQDAVTGLTAMRMDEGLDTGPMLLHKEVPILEQDTAGSLHDRLAELSGEFLLTTLKKWRGEGIREKLQRAESATYAPKVDRTMALVDWKRPARDLSARIRAFDPWPGAYTTCEGREIRLFSPFVVPGRPFSEPMPGRVSVLPGDAVEVETGEGLIRIGELQLAGKKRLAAADFLRGFNLVKGTILGIAT